MDSKERLIVLLRYLKDNTDEETEVSAADIRRMFGDLGESVSAPTLRDDITSLQRAKEDMKAGKEWNFPENRNFLSGTTDWIPQVFEFETDESWREHPETLVYLQTRYAAGVAHFDDVRLDKISK